LAPRSTNSTYSPVRWKDGSTGFFAFLEDVRPRVRDGRGGFVPYMPTGEMRDAITAAIDGNYSIACLSWPRRHGKTTAAIMIVLWRFLTRQGESVAIVANSEKQVVDTAFKSLVDAFRQTPLLAKLVKAGEIKILADRIDAPETSSAIQAFPANAGALWGKKLTVAQVSELHAATSGAVLDALQGSLLDSAGSLLLVDSTVGPTSSPLWGLYQAAQQHDSGVYFSHIQYADLEDAIANAPAWIDTKKLRALSRTMLPQQLGLWHLNRWGDASSSLFSAEVIAQCTGSTYPSDTKEIAAGASFAVGGGLDRAFGLSRHGDSTYTAAVLKTVLDDDEEHIFVLAVDKVAFSRLDGIRANLTRYGREFGMSQLGLESFNAQDVHDWATQQTGFGPGTELIHPSRRLKANAFTTMHAIAAEGRLHIDPRFGALVEEMRTFEVIFDSKETDGASSIPKFSHARGKHDDALHAVVWAIFSLRESTISGYELDGVNCYGNPVNVPLCALNGGEMIPLACADTCRSMTQARSLHTSYLSRKPLAPLPLDEFIVKRVSVSGFHTMPRS
jgi:hypothetical protein